ncbi:MAG: alpha/beta fold hydrolase [Dehalococcoidia bacterium]|nr:alpha/beta fold hydrolase [Dehalococcoidia bacterium]
MTGDPTNGGPHAPSGDEDEHLTLSIQGARAREGEAQGEMLVELNTTRGVMTLHLHPCEGKTGCVVFLSGAGGGTKGPANEVFVSLARDLVAEGVTSVRVQYREAGEFEECVLDALGACSFLKGIGGQKAVLVGHSFGGAVAVRAAALAPLVEGVVAMSSQRYGTQEVDELGKPLLLIHGTEDEVLDQEASKDIYRRASEPKQLVLLEDTGHGLTESAERVRDLVRAFVLEHAGDADETP